jgi:hypothetical protein
VAKSRPKPSSPFTGRWLIISVSPWEQDFIDEEERDYFEFDENGSRESHFGYVHGHMDCPVTTRVGESAVECTSEGNDEMDPARGRGWAVLLHGGDDSEFVAKKKGQSRKK